MGASQLTDTNNDLLLRRDHYYELLLQTGLFVLEHVYCFPSRCSGSGLNGEEVSRTSLVGGVEGDGAAVIVVDCPLGPCLEGQ